MSTIIILTPVIISSWPAITAAVAGAAAAMGLMAKDKVKEAVSASNVQEQNSVEIELHESQVLAGNLATGQKIVLTKDGIEICVTRDDRGRCCVCASGKGYSKGQLKQIAEEFSGKVTQAFVYNRVKTELNNKGFKVVNEEVSEDQSVLIHVRHWVD